MKQIQFGTYKSYDDFSLILSSKTISSPDLKIETVEITGADGELDMSEYFGEIKFKNRKLTFAFATIVPMDEFSALFSLIQNKIHGQKMRIVLLDDEPEFYYVGRISVSEWKADKNIGKITVECDCEPYKYKTNETIISLDVNGSATYIYTNLRKHVTPQFTTDAEMQITFGDNTYTASAGTFTIPEIVFSEGNNIISYTGTGNVIVEYQEGEL